MRKKNIESVLWIAIVSLCSATACNSSSPSEAAEGQSAALSNARDDDNDGDVDENDEGMDEDEDGRVDEAHEHGDMCMKRHRGRRTSRMRDSDASVADERQDRRSDAATDEDEAADEAAEHADRDRDREADEAVDEAAGDAAGSGGGASGAGGGRARHGDNKHRERIDAIDCSDVPDTTAPAAGSAVDAGL